MVDDADMEALAPFNWCALHAAGGKVYAVRWKKGKAILMHRVLCPGAPGAPVVDHHDGDGLNNSRTNLRAADYSLNQGNRRKSFGKSSVFKGVSRAGRKWRAYIKAGGKQANLGFHETECQAARAYNAAAQTVFGPFALLNQLG